MTINTMNAMEEFRAGVTACLRSWSALRAAVESGWGGGERESQNKADQLRREIFDIMNGSQYPIPNFDQTDLADDLAIYLEEQFSVTLEDNSEQQVAEAIFRMFETCARGDTSLARQMVAHADSALAVTSHFPFHLQTPEHDDDDSDDDEAMVDDQAVGIQTHAAASVGQRQIPADYNLKPLFGEARKVGVSTKPLRQLGDVVDPAKEADVEMDEDGFAPVKAKGRRKR